METGAYVKAAYDKLHQMPEIGLEEYKTSAFLAEELTKLGYQIHTQVGGFTGLIGVLDSHSPGPVLGIRADMDALAY